MSSAQATLEASVGALGRRERERVRELAAELRACPGDRGASLAALLPALAEQLGAARAGVYVPSPADRGWQVELVATSGFPPTKLAEYLSFVATQQRWAGYGPVLPEREQRNAVLGLHDVLAGSLSAQRTFRDAAYHAAGLRELDQLRVLLCDGHRLLAWAGGFREEPFGSREHAILAMLAPALCDAMRADRAERNASFLSSALSGALELAEDPVFVLDAAGRVRHANDRGVALIGADPGRHEHISNVLRGAALRGALVQRLEAGGAVISLRAEPPGPDTRLGRARRDWALTARETEILPQIAGGASNKDIVRRLGCTEANVELHVTHLLRKADVESRAELVARYWTLRSSQSRRVIARRRPG